jgi:hypothetical protein
MQVQGDSPKRSITGAEFFHRFPLLHIYLLDELKKAADAVEEGSSEMHPALYPILVLLSRLRPSLHNRNSAEVPPIHSLP